MKNKSLEVGDTVEITEFFPSGLVNAKKPWGNFDGVVEHIYEHSACVNVKQSKGLTDKQKKATLTGKIIVSFKHMKGVDQVSSLVDRRGTFNGHKHVSVLDRQAGTASRLQKLIAEGYTVTQAADLLNIYTRELQAISLKWGVKSLPRFKVRWIRPNGITEYFPSIRAAQHRKLIKTNFKGHEENENGVFDSGSWFKRQDGTFGVTPRVLEGEPVG